MPSVLHIVRSFDVSGRSRLVEDLCRGMAVHGWTSSVAVLSDAAAHRPDGIHCQCIGGSGPAAVIRLGRAARAATVLHSHGRGAAVHAALAGFMVPGKLWIHTVHRSDGDLISAKPWIRALVMRRANGVTAVSDAARSEFARANHWNGSIQVIHNGIAVEKFSGRRVASSRSGPLLGAVMNLSPDKDFDTLLRGFARFRGEQASARLLVIGDGPAAGQVRALAGSLGLGEAVEFAGFRTDVPAMLRTLDVLVHAARTEGLGLAILEAMAARVPVVASDVGGISEIVRDGVNGRLFPAGDAAALCRAVASALAQPDATAAMVERGFRDVAERFSVEGMCAAYARLYCSR